MEALQALQQNVMETYFTLESTFSDLDNASFIASATTVYLLGQQHPADITVIKEFTAALLWFTYRKNFSAIGGTGPSTDQGWGCMLRCGQMLLAQALSVLHLRSSWKWTKNSTDETYRRLLRMFQDKRTSTFSIHQIAQMGVSEGKALGHWFGPNTIAQVLKKLVVYDDWSNMAIHVAMDNILISADVQAMARAKPPKQGEVKTASDYGGGGGGAGDTWRPLLIIVPLRLGLTSINRCYLSAIQEYFKLPQCVGIIGGRPNHAVYFYGIVNEQLVYLDPHVCQEAVNLDSDQLHPFSSEPNSTISSPELRSPPEYINNPASDVEALETSPPHRLDKEAGDEDSVQEPDSTELVDALEAVKAKRSPPWTTLGTGMGSSSSDACSNSTDESTDNFDDSTYHCNYVLHMPFQSLDPSLALSFICVTEKDYHELVGQLPEVIAASDPPLFELLERRPPGYPRFVPYMGIDTKIEDYMDFGDPKFDSEEEFEVLTLDT